LAPGALNLPLRGENHGALPAYVVKASAAIFGTSPLGYRALHVVLGLCTILMVYMLARDAYGRVAARWAAALLAFNEYFLAFSSRATANTPYLFLVTASVLMFSRSLGNEGPLGLYGAAVATGLAFYCKEHAVLLLPIFAVVVLVYHRGWLWRPHPYLAAVLFVLIIAPDVWWNATTDPETARVSYSDSYVAQSTYAAHLRRVGGLGLSPYPAMFYARGPVTGLLRWVTGREVPDVAGYPSLNPVIGIVLVLGVLAATFGHAPREKERRLLLALGWGVFLFFTAVRRGDPPNRLSSVSWLWVESTLIPAVIMGGIWLSTLSGRLRLTAWVISALALFYAVESLLSFPPE
jgi:4-amino-4-deoxy-L-arabinose transferase-like glycosyltransferase